MLKCLFMVAIAVAAPAGCKSKPQEEAKVEAGPASASAPSATSPIKSASAPASGEINPGTIMEKLEMEAMHRPTANPSVEVVFDAITKKLNIVLEDKKQVAGWTIGARFCQKAVTKSSVHVVVCEFTDGPSAAKGLETASSTNKYLKRREVLLRRSTTLSIHPTAETKQAEADAKKIKDAFNAL